MRHNFLNHFARHIRQSKIATRVTIGQSFVVDSHQMQNRGMQIMNVNAIVNGAESKFISFTIRLAAFYTASCEPRCESIMIVIAAVAIFRCWRSAEFAAPQHQRFIKQSALL